MTVAKAIVEAEHEVDGFVAAQREAIARTHAQKRRRQNARWFGWFMPCPAPR